MNSAVLAVALGAGILATTGSAFAATQTGAAVAAAGWPAQDWYLQGPYQTKAACKLAFDDAVQNGQYTSLLGCHWYRGGSVNPAGYYYEVYIP
ncbi:hypothetical protein Skr01_42270 [Sphaerisporangium krabiense]|nr:hypothetical protein Skr01_42270 [Sphaerisporangium krabiense]